MKEVTPEHIYQDRRLWLRNSAWAFLATQVVGLPRLWAKNTAPVLAPAVRPPSTAQTKYLVNDVDRPMTSEKFATSYNNFYEFSLEKDEPAKLASKWTPTEPWKVEISGLDGKATSRSFTLQELIALGGGEEERVYRFRCVEAWSMVVPWKGFSLGTLIANLKPKKTAKFVAFTSYANPKDFPNIKSLATYPWPYREGLRLDEAMNPLSFMATGLYGKKLPQQNGAPLRLVVPWKYGFKSIKSVVKIEFTETQPVTLWNQLSSNEYGFYANVNPEVEHPRWSQATERILDGKLFPTRIKTLKFNGYEKEVAGLYAGLDLKKNF